MIYQLVMNGKSWVGGGAAGGQRYAWYFREPLRLEINFKTTVGKEIQKSQFDCHPNPLTHHCGRRKSTLTLGITVCILSL